MGHLWRPDPEMPLSFQGVGSWLSSQSFSFPLEEKREAILLSTLDGNLEDDLFMHTPQCILTSLADVLDYDSSNPLPFALMAGADGNWSTKHQDIWVLV